ncbi:tripartite tricarboxylate transporter TctB family protein [Arthrobacter sp. MYb227]|uniref:tripartite tricarboxylate transporter TctB family protein n=1 Tax=Arthrobacter sp. MYb227 TaxID=1848601 RepID=UPI0015E2E2A5|nr:tripartite tricarboxylate transporter TctB family protein [Arthrobacter sp. MYb227]
MTDQPPIETIDQEAAFEAAHHQEEPLVRDLPVRLRELVSVAACIGLGIWILVAGKDIIVRGTAELGPVFWPNMLGTGLIIFGVVIVLNNVLRGVRKADVPERITVSGIAMFGMTLAIAIGYLMLWNVLQFWMITFVALALFTLVLGGRSWKATLAFPAVTTAVLHFLFIVALRVPL